MSPGSNNVALSVTSTTAALSDKIAFDANGSEHQRLGGLARTHAGVYVTRLHLDACFGTDVLRVSNAVDGWQALTLAFKACGVQLVMPKSAAGYERGFVQELQSKGIESARVSQHLIREFVRTRIPDNRKTRVDAQLLRELAISLVALRVDSNSLVFGSKT